MQTEAKLFLIDAMALAYRCFYALIRRGGLTTSKGLPVSVPYGSAQFIHKLINDHRPDYLALVGESPTAKTFRHEIYPGYKEKRSSMPEMMEQQLPLFYELFDCLAVKRLELEGYEADDVIGTLARRFTGVKVYIVSQDKDFMQLVGNNTYIFDKDYRVLGVEAVRKKFDCEPAQVIDYLALTGDASDDVPGVRGIGDKRARQLLSEFGSLDNIYDNIDKTTAEMRKKLRDGRDNAYLSRKLVTIDTDAKLPLIELDELRYQQTSLADNQQLYDFYQRLEFKKLLSENFTKLATFTCGDEGILRPINSKEELQNCLARLSSLTQLTVEVVPSERYLVAAIPSKILFGNQKELWSIDVNGVEGSRQLMAEFLGSSSIMKIGYHLKGVIKVLSNVDIVLGGELYDVLMCDYLLNPNVQNHSLLSVCQRYLAGVTEIPTIERRLLLVTRLAEIFADELANHGMESVARNIEMPLVQVLADMEMSGVFLDVDLLSIYQRQLAAELSSLELEIFCLAGKDFNVKSPRQLQDVLFNRLQVHKQLGITKEIPRTKNGYSTNESVLQMLSKHPLVKLLIKYRELSKLKSSYVDLLPRYVYSVTGCLHTNFRQDVAATGRLSSDGPNLQNIPRHSTHGKKIRCAFTTRSIDNVIVSADYSQIEIRLLACLAKADSLIEAFNAGVDIHRLTAAKVVGVDSDQVTDEQRSQAKAINFGIIYGMGARKLARTIDVSVSEAQEFIDRYFTVYPEIKTFTDKLIKSAMSKGYSETPLGRRRPIVGINDSNPGIYARACNMAINSCIQGYAADLIKMAMLDITKVIKEKKLASKMLLQVHDELIFETPREELTVACQEIKTAMEQAIVSDVVFQVEVKSGATWLDQWPIGSNPDDE